MDTTTAIGHTLQPPGRINQKKAGVSSSIARHFICVLFEVNSLSMLNASRS
jgi:hypothetical protein